MYVNRKKAADWFSIEKPDWPMPIEKINDLLSDNSIADENDLVKLREQNPTQYQEQKGMYAGQYSEAENLIKIFRYANASIIKCRAAHL